jgi:hypothetical protein
MIFVRSSLILAAVLSAPLTLCAQSSVDGVGGLDPQPVITVNGSPFLSWASYLASPEFRAEGLRCKTPDRDPSYAAAFSGAPSDCGYNANNPAAEYAPTSLYVIPVVVHVIKRTNGVGDISPAMVQSQIDVLNEDFLALGGTLGGNGLDTLIQFELASVDPSGNPTTGITYSTNNTWFNDGGGYFNTLNWDPDRYLNIYTNSADGALGYVPDIPQGGIVGNNGDRVVILWSAFGRNAPIGPPYDKGRTATHEVGHYLGLYHTFDGGCGSASACGTSGDLLCDTERESSPNYGCGVGSTSCSSPDPVRNYMNYSDDTCMQEFTEEQARRMRCTLENWRPQLAQSAVDAWVDLGQGLAGSAGTPSLVGAGDLSAGSTVTLSVSGAKAGAAAGLIIGLSQINAPFKGGVLVPAPDLILAGLAIDGSGNRVDSFVFPAGVPSGSVLFDQYWIVDAAGPSGFAATNAVSGTTP